MKILFFRYLFYIDNFVLKNILFLYYSWILPKEKKYIELVTYNYMVLDLCF
jgi:hypothetical protein